MSDYTFWDWAALIFLIVIFYGFCGSSLMKALFDDDKDNKWRRPLWAGLLVAAVFPIYSKAKQDDFEKLQQRVELLEKRQRLTLKAENPDAK